MLLRATHVLLLIQLQDTCERKHCSWANAAVTVRYCKLPVFLAGLSVLMG